jgi:hypothetical protein
MRDLGKLLGWNEPEKVAVDVEANITVADLMRDAEGKTRGLHPKPKGKKAG